MTTIDSRRHARIPASLDNIVRLKMSHLRWSFIEEEPVEKSPIPVPDLETGYCIWDDNSSSSSLLSEGSFFEAVREFSSMEAIPILSDQPPVSLSNDVPRTSLAELLAPLHNCQRERVVLDNLQQSWIQDTIGSSNPPNSEISNSNQISRHFLQSAVTPLPWSEVDKKKDSSYFVVTPIPSYSQQTEAQVWESPGIEQRSPSPPRRVQTTEKTESAKPERISLVRRNSQTVSGDEGRKSFAFLKKGEMNQCFLQPRLSQKYMQDSRVAAGSFVSSPQKRALFKKPRVPLSQEAPKVRTKLGVSQTVRSSNNHGFTRPQPDSQEHDSMGKRLVLLARKKPDTRMKAELYNRIPAKSVSPPSKRESSVSHPVDGRLSLPIQYPFSLQIPKERFVGRSKIKLSPRQEVVPTSPFGSKNVPLDELYLNDSDFAQEQLPLNISGKSPVLERENSHRNRLINDIAEGRALRDSIRFRRCTFHPCVSR